MYSCSGDDSDYRLSPTSRARYKAWDDSSWWWVWYLEVNYNFDFKAWGELTDKPKYEVVEGLGKADKFSYLMVSDLPFVKHLYLNVNFDFNALLSEFRSKLGSYLEKFSKRDGKYYYKVEGDDEEYEVIIPEFYRLEEINRSIYSCYLHSIKNIEVFLNGDLFFYFRARKDQEFPFSTEKLVDNFDDFEKYLKEFYGIDGYSLIFPEGSENSPVEMWRNNYPDYKNYIKIVDGFWWVDDSFVERINNDRLHSYYKAVNEILDKILELKEYEYDYRFYSIRVNELPEDLKEKWKRAESHLAKLEIESKKNTLKEYIKDAKDFLSNRLYKIPSKSPIDISLEFIDPIYFYVSNKEKGEKMIKYYEEVYGDLYREARELYINIKNNISSVYTVIGVLYYDKRDKVWNVKVPSDMKGKFIGKGGKNIKWILEEVGTVKRINVV